MSEMFYGCKNLDSINLSNFNTANVTKMNGMFSACESLKSLDLSGFNTSEVTDMNGIFNQCKSLTDINFGANFNTGKVTDMRAMFRLCESLTSLDLSRFNTESVLLMGGVNSGMFDGCSSLTALDLSGFNTGSVGCMSEMFQNCSALSTLDISSFNTSQVSEMNSMFENCSSLTELDLSSFEMGETNVTQMFGNCSNLTTIYVASDANWSNVNDDNSGQLDSPNIFGGCINLKGGSNTLCTGTNIGKDFAKIDGGTNDPGYFTSTSFLYVDSKVTATGLGTVESPFNSLTRALVYLGVVLDDVANAKYTICIDGELNESVTIPNSFDSKYKAIELRGKTGNAHDKLIGAGSSSVLTINTTVPVTISKLQITGGNAEYGGGINMCSGSHVTLGFGALVGEEATSVATSSDYANTASTSGGGIYNNGGELILGSGSMVCHNYASPYAYNQDNQKCGAGICSVAGKVTIRAGAKVIYNYSSSRGGGIGLVNGAELTITGGNIDNNTAIGWGGGIFFSNYGSNSPVVNMTGGSVSNNSITGTYNWGEAGGGIYIDGKGTFKMSGTALLSSNSSSLNGGGVSIRNGKFEMTGGAILGNTADFTGGAMWCNKNNGDETCTFQIGDSAYIPCSGIRNNDVYLSSGSKITVTSELKRNAPVASITPEEFSEGLSVVDVSQPELINESIKFALTDNPDYGVANGTIVRVLGLQNSYSVGFDTFKEAVESAEDGAVIYLAQRVYAANYNNRDGNNNLKLDVPSGKTVTIKRFPGYKGLLIETYSHPYGILEVNNTKKKASGRLILDGGSEDGLEADDALFYDNAGCTLYNITFQNNNNTKECRTSPYYNEGKGGGFRQNQSATTSLVNCVIQNCQASRGGGIYANSSFWLSGTVIKNCMATDADGGGGIFAGENMNNNRWIVLNEGGLITNCTANGVRNNYHFDKYQNYNGTYVYSLFVGDDGNDKIINDLTNMTDDEIFKALGYVDLGLPSGTLWATKNVGATSPEEFGDYYAWGETEPKVNYSQSQYHYEDTQETLPLGNDAANVNWGNGWVMPSASEFEELINYCQWIWSEGYNNSTIKGYIVYRRSEEQNHTYNTASDAHIFLPAAGVRNGSEDPAGQNVYCYYLSATLDTEQVSEAKALVIPGTENHVISVTRYCGYSVRPVRRP